MQAHVTALYCDSDPTEFLDLIGGEGSSPYFSEALIKMLRERAEARRGAAEHNFSEWLSRSGVQFVVSTAETRAASAEFITAAGNLSNLVRDYAVTNDLVVASLPQTGVPERSTVLETALFGAGRPVLALPKATPSTVFVAPVAIAWNYSAEAARAMNAALPILEMVGEAVLLMAGHHQDDQAARRAVAFLTWHGIKAQALKLGQADKPTDLIAGKVRELGAGLLVMGAYSHTRAHEFMFGGMTSYMLENGSVPLLLAH
jgi:nucleotide-binding universal stress UspA family protein